MLPDLPFDWLRFYLTLNAQCVVLACAVCLLGKVSVPAATRLYCSYLLVVCTAVFAFINQFMPRHNFLTKQRPIWDAIQQVPIANLEAVRQIPAALADPADLTFGLSIWAAVILAAGLWTLYLARALARLHSLLRQATLIRRHGKLLILAADNIAVPFAYWRPFRAYIVLPTRLLTRAEDFRFALAHELQHHRQGDTKWLHFLTLLRILCPWNPFVYILERRISELQEFACDEAMAGHHRTSSLAYCRSLLWVAQTATHFDRQRFVGTASMAEKTHKNLLTRRIAMLLADEQRRPATKVLVALAGATLATMLGVATAASTDYQDRHISAKEAQALVDNAQLSGLIATPINDLVLKQLNRYLGTARGRQFMRDSLAEMENHKELIGAAIEKYRLPRELIAVPIVESGFRNLPDDGRPARGAGLWMFLARTARTFGLRVDQSVDERLNVALETDAAMRMFSALHLQFRDWHLALLAYNTGDGHVRKGIDQTGSRNAFELVRNGIENDPHYLARVIAAILIMNNPSSLD